MASSLFISLNAYLRSSSILASMILIWSLDSLSSPVGPFFCLRFVSGDLLELWAPEEAPNGSLANLLLVLLFLKSLALDKVFYERSLESLSSASYVPVFLKTFLFLVFISSWGSSNWTNETIFSIVSFSAILTSSSLSSEPELFRNMSSLKLIGLGLLALKMFLECLRLPSLSVFPSSSSFSSSSRLLILNPRS